MVLKKRLAICMGHSITRSSLYTRMLGSPPQLLSRIRNPQQVRNLYGLLPLHSPFTPASASARPGTRALCPPQAPRATGRTLCARGGLCFVSSAEVGRAFDTGGIFSARGETPAARASLNFKRRLVGFEVFARRRLFTLSEEDDNTGIFAVQKALEKRFRESDGSTGVRKRTFAVEYLQHRKATLDGLWTAFRTFGNRER